MRPLPGFLGRGGTRGGACDRGAAPAFRNDPPGGLAERPADAATATRLLIARLLHEPSALLRDMASARTGGARGGGTALSRLFRLARDEDEGKGDETWSISWCGWSNAMRAGLSHGAPRPQDAQDFGPNVARICELTPTSSASWPCNRPRGSRPIWQRSPPIQRAIPK